MKSGRDLRKENKEFEKLKKEIYNLLDNQKDFLQWLNSRAEELHIMLGIHTKNKEKRIKTEAKLEFILEILAFMNNKGDEKNEL